MAKLTRVIQKIFGVDAGVNQRTQIGSTAAGLPAYTTDPYSMQQLQNFKDGLFGICLGENSPVIQDMNSLYFLITRQLAYLFQQGIPEWNDETEYHIGSWVSDSAWTYRSLEDDNVGNPLSDTTKWERIGQNYEFIELLSRLESEVVAPVNGNVRLFYNQLTIKKKNQFGSYKMASQFAAQCAVVMSVLKRTTILNYGSSRQIGDVNGTGFKIIAVMNDNLGAAGKVVVTTDGSTWTSKTAPNSFNYLNLFKIGTAFIATGLNGVTPVAMISIDEGETWSNKVLPSHSQLYTMHTTTGMSGENSFLASSAQIIISADNGVNWNGVDISSTGITFVRSITTFGSFILVLSGTNGLGQNVVATSGDNGATWEVVPNNLPNEARVDKIIGNWSNPVDGGAGEVYLANVYIPSLAETFIYRVSSDLSDWREVLGGNGQNPTLLKNPKTNTGFLFSVGATTVGFTIEGSDAVYTERDVSNLGRTINMSGVPRYYSIGSGSGLTISGAL